MDNYAGSALLRGIARCRDEVFLALMILLQRHYLKTFGASFSESLCGLKRVRVTRRRGAYAGFSPSDKLLAMMELCVVPYLLRVLAKWRASAAAAPTEAERSATSSSSDSSSATFQRPPEKPTLRSSLRSALFSFFMTCSRCVPAAAAGTTSATLLYQIMYAFGASDHFNAASRLTRSTLIRLTPQDMMGPSTAVAGATQPGRLMKLWWGLLRAARIGLIASVVVFKLVEWYYSSAFEAQRREVESSSSQDGRRRWVTVKPPMPPQRHVSGIAVPADSRLCPICGEVRKNPAICGTGILFCFRCIANYVSEHGRCPVTLHGPLSVDRVRRVYQDITDGDVQQ